MMPFVRTFSIIIIFLVTHLSSYHEKAINALYELAKELPAICLPHRDGESCYVPFPTAQQVNLPACSPDCPFNAERQAGKLCIPISQSLV